MGAFSEYIKENSGFKRTRLGSLRKTFLRLNRGIHYTWSNAMRGGAGKIKSPNQEWLLRMKFLEALVLSHAEKHKKRERDKNPRVMHFIGSLQAGGAERQLCNCVIGQKKHGLNVSVLLLHAPLKEHGHYASLLNSAGIPVKIAGEKLDENFKKVLRHNRRIRNLLLDIPEEFKPMTEDIFGELLADTPDVFHSWLDHPNAWGGLAALMADVPLLVLSTRNMNPMNFPYLATPYMHAFYSKLALSPSVRFINNSEAGANDYTQWLGLPNERISVVSNGVEFDPLQSINEQEANAFRGEIGVPLSAKVVAGIFRLSEEKQPMIFLEVARRLLQKDPSLYFVIAGIGPMEFKMKDFIHKEGLANRILLLGRRKDIHRIYSVAWFTLLCSSFEGTPNVLLEAQGLGCPVIATRVGGVMDTVDEGKTGFLVESGNLEEIIEACNKMLSREELRKEMSVNGPKFIRRRFNVDDMVRKTMHNYCLSS